MPSFDATDGEAYRDLARKWAATVTIVTCRLRPEATGGQPMFDGLTATAFLTVSINPPRVLVSISQGSQALDSFRHAEAVAVNLLAPSQVDLAAEFARPHDQRGDLWERVGFTLDASGAPILNGAVGAFAARPAEFIEAGDHVLMLADVTAIHVFEGEDTLAYHNRHYSTLTPLP